jgi:uncharacterized protein YxjI
MSLLASNVNYYVLKEDWWGWGSGDIFDQFGTPIGHMHRRALSIRAFTEVKHNDDSMSFSVEQKLISLRPSYMIKDPQGNVLGRTNRKILAFFRPKLWLENTDGQKLLEAQGNFLGRDFKIKDAQGQLVAQVGKSDFFRDLLLGGSLFDFSDTYAIKLFNENYDKRLLLGFVVAIDNSVHDQKKR